MGNLLTQAALEAPSPETFTLFCLPHAGGSAVYYSGFGKFFPDGVVVRPLELPGRGRRAGEPLLTSIEALSEDLFAQILPVARTAPYALFGHSMGALLAYRCALLARARAVALPTALFVSSSAIPGRAAGTLPLPPERLWEQVIGMGGIPQCIAESPDFRKYLEPVLRADFTAVDTWRPAPADSLPIPIAVFLGSDDLVSRADAREWAKLTSDSCDLHAFPGNHFYLQEHWESLANLVARKLLPSGASDAP